MNIWKILNIISLLGIIALFFLHLSSEGESPETVREASSPAIKQKIVYINSDTLRANYQLVKEMNATLEEDYSARERDISLRQQRYEKDASYFQQQVESGALSEQSAQIIYEDLMKNQQQLLDLRDQYTEEIAEREYRMNERYVDSVYSFLERYNKDGRFDYVLGYSRGSGILNAKDTLDITWDVIRQMNAEYRTNQAEKTNK